jgi:hypothetical protein
VTMGVFIIYLRDLLDSGWGLAQVGGKYKKMKGFTPSKHRVIKQ